MGGAVGGLRTGEPGRDRAGVRDCAGRGFVCVVVRGADAAKNVRRAVRRILQEHPPMGTADARMGQVRRF